jgi:predicted nucleic acid-binding protein
LPSVVSNPRIFRDPTPLDVALDAVRRLQVSFAGGFLAEGEGYLGALERIARPARLQGALVHDARVAALCLFHGVRVLWSADRDFSRFPELAVVNPLTAA